MSILCVNFGINSQKSRKNTLLSLLREPLFNGWPYLWQGKKWNCFLLYYWRIE